MSILHRISTDSRLRLALAFTLFACASTLHAQIGAPGGAPGGGASNIHVGGGGPDPISRPPRPKTLTGSVRDLNGKIIKDAVIYLKNDSTSNVTTLSADNQGVYRFGELSPTTDYEVWAQTADKKKSPTKTISSFDTRSDVTVNLKIE